MSEKKKSQWLLDWINNCWNSHKKRPAYNWNQINICRTTWMYIYGVSHWKLNKAIQSHSRGQKLIKSHSLFSTRHPFQKMSIIMGWISDYINNYCRFGTHFQLSAGKSFQSLYAEMQIELQRTDPNVILPCYQP